VLRQGQGRQVKVTEAEDFCRPTTTVVRTTCRFRRAGSLARGAARQPGSRRVTVDPVLGSGAASAAALFNAAGPANASERICVRRAAPSPDRRMRDYAPIWMVLPERIELSTSPLPRECSTTELRQRRVLDPLGAHPEQIHQPRPAGKTRPSQSRRGGTGGRSKRWLTKGTAPPEDQATDARIFTNA
jgi:hypothetical protein